MTARQWSHHWVERGGKWVATVGLTGMLGFIASSVTFANGRLTVTHYLAAVGVSLAVFAFALTVGHLAEAFEQRRR